MLDLPYDAVGFRFSPEASPEDGALGVVVAHGLSVLKILFLLPLAFLGKHVGFKGISILRCKSVQVEAEAALPLHTDGEPGFLSRSTKAAVLEEKLNVIAG